MRRRSFLTGAAALAFAGAGSALAAPSSPPLPRARRLHSPDYTQVRLHDGPARAQFSDTLETLLAYDEKALLRPFRQAAGMPIEPHGFGGWYDFDPAFNAGSHFDGFIPGHSFGQYVSALSRGYAASGDVRAQAKVRRLLAGYAPTITTKFYDGYALPAYTYDKTLMGLLDAHQFARDPQAMSLVGPATDAVLPWLPDRALDRNNPKDQATRPTTNPAFQWDETYTLPENLYLAAARGAGTRYHDLARRYLLDAPYFDPLAAGKNVLPHRHAYSHLNALNSAMQAYLSDNSVKHLQAAQNGLQMVLDQSFVTGGWGPNETFIEPGSGGLGDSLSKTHSSFETPCGTYGQFKLCRYLMSVTGDSRYGDVMERMLYNGSLGALPLKTDGHAFYYSDYNDSGSKFYHHDICPCCSGSIGQLTADYGMSSYFEDAAGIYVNLYLPSTFSGKDGVSITQDTRYPLADEVRLSVKTARPSRMALRLRIPQWAGPGTRIAINGRTWGQPVLPGRFAAVMREWRDGDTVQLVLDRTRRVEAVDAQHPDRLAVLQGPLVLFALGDDPRKFSRAELLTIAQTAPEAAEWSLGSGAQAQAFKPFYAITDEKYRLYQFT